MSAVRCPVLVGRGAELAALRSALAAARLGRGAAVVLTGPAGIGKSRLAREVAAAAKAWQLPVLVGRAVEAGRSTAFRPLAEALLAGLRRVPDPDAAAPAPFRPALGRLIPQWRTDGPADDSLVVLGEAVLRLLAALAGDRGLLVVLEDLHWADPETLAVLEYLADNVAEDRVLLLATVRNDPGPALSLVRTLAARHAATLLPVPTLAGGELAEMAAACRGGTVDDDLLHVLRERTGGTPLLVEELLATGVDPAAAVPAGVAELVAARAAVLPAGARRCVEAAAVLGPQFDHRLLAAVLDVGEDEVLAALRTAVDVGLVEVADDGFRFHHALGRDAVLAAMLPPERAEWARRGLAAVARAHPELAGAWCDVAADLAVRAGDRQRAADVLVEAGRRNLARGALASAEAVLQRGRELGGDGPAAAAADELLAEVLAQAGKTAEAVAVTVRTLDRLRRVPGSERAVAEAELRLARAHAAAGEWGAAAERLDAARTAGGADLRLRILGVGAHVAMGDSRFEDAHALAVDALAGGEAAADPEAVCDALLVLGRLARRDDLAAAEELFGRARTVAEQAGLAVAATRAVEELAIGDVQESLRLERLQEARTRAAELGDVATVAVLDLQAAAILVTRWEPEQAAEAARSCIRAARRFRLATLPKGLVLGAVADDMRGRPEAAEAALAEALRLAPHDNHLLGEVWGARAHRALGAADDARAREHLQRAVAAFALRPNEVTGSPAVGLWAVLSVAADPSCNSRPPTAPPVNRWNRGLFGFADAVAAGRAGDPAAAAAAFVAADAVLREPVDVGWHRRQARRIAAAAAVTDGWGDPAGWAAEDLPVLDERGEERWAGAVRGLLRRAGGTVPRRGRGDAEVPAGLRELGVTSRETDVLLLVAEGRANREIAERLFLSPRTVEKHVERLLAKTGTGRRAELVAYAVRVLR